MRNKKKICKVKQLVNKFLLLTRQHSYNWAPKQETEDEHLLQETADEHLLHAGVGGALGSGHLAVNAVLVINK